MVKGWEKLGNVKSKGAYIDVFNPFWVNEVYESNSSINCRMLFEFIQLTQVNEIEVFY